MTSETLPIYVFASWNTLKHPVLMGELHIGVTRGQEQFWFEYDKAWQKSALAVEVDPDLPLLSGKLYPTNSVFGVFADASPDRWGRRLMMRREARMAKTEGRQRRTLRESDYLLGVDDFGRLGALRFKTDFNQAFLQANGRETCPPLTELRALQQASLALEGDDESKIDEALRLLLRPGGSLGGARPKSNVIDTNGSLWIAKFPSINDEVDMGAWEEITATLARSVGIDMSKSRAEKLAGHKHHTFLTERFDRNRSGNRFLYASAMNLMNKKDGESNDSSYFDILEFLTQKGSAVRAQLSELWKRILFSVLVSNTDDHLRNHGFLYDHAGNGWKLSPAFDMNPNPEGQGLTLNIDQSNNALDLDLVLEVAEYYQIQGSEARDTLQFFKSKIAHWHSLAKVMKLKNSDIEYMDLAFERHNKA